MAQRIQTVCDVHQSVHDEEVDGFTWTVSITAPGARAATYEVDLCEQDGKGLSDVAAMVAELGRRVGGPGRPAKLPTVQQAAVAGSAGGKAAAAKAKEGGPYTCPDCSRDFTTPQGRGVHRTRVHGYVGGQDGETGGDE